MATPIPGHICNMYCRDGCHAIPSIGKVGVSMQDVRVSLTKSAKRCGWDVVSFKLCEADPVQWGASHGLDIDLALYDTAYIAIIKESE